MSRSLPTYDEIVHRIKADAGIPLRRCRGIEPSGLLCYENHKAGSVTPQTQWDQLVVHWADRSTRRVSLRPFIRLVAEALVAHDHPEPRSALWRRYHVARQTNDLARSIGMRLSASSAERERLAIRAMVVKEPPGPFKTEVLEWLG